MELVHVRVLEATQECPLLVYRLGAQAHIDPQKGPIYLLHPIFPHCRAYRPFDDEVVVVTDALSAHRPHHHETCGHPHLAVSIRQVAVHLLSLYENMLELEMRATGAFL